MKRSHSLVAIVSAAAMVHAPAAHAYADCGDPAGPAENVTATHVSCADALTFARKVAGQGPTSSRRIALPGWRSYYARIRREGGEYDVRATRGGRVIHFQYRAAATGGRTCDPNYAGACLRPDVSDYDCAGGSGNGPYYTGPVRVVGDDHYGLDADGDGYACEDS
jgi:hypothetical protein